jgi:hypothetical protein
MAGFTGSLFAIPLAAGFIIDIGMDVSTVRVIEITFI